MKKALITLLLFFLPASVTAEPSDYIKFSLGAITGLAIHESGHFIAGEITDTDLHWNSPTRFTFDTKSSRDAAIISSAGILSNMLTTEAILNTKIPKQNWYTIGLLTFSVAQPLFYVFTDQVFHDAPDIETMNDNGFKRDYINTAIVLHSLFSIYRVFHKTDIPLYFKVSEKTIFIELIVHRF